MSDPTPADPNPHPEFADSNPTFAGQLSSPSLRLRIIGVGGAGANVVDRLKLGQLDRIDLTVIDSDAKVLNQSPLPSKHLLGRALTRGFGAGGDIEQGRRVAQADRDSLARIVEGVDLLFIVTGLGGGIGSGVSPLLAELAAEAGALVIAFVTLPFTTEGAARKKVADEALSELRTHCHAVIPLPNDLLLQQGQEDTTVLEALALADEWIDRGVRAIWSLLFRTGLMQVDFATLQSTLSVRGTQTLFGLGAGEGPDAVEQALHDLSMCPLLHLPNITQRADSLVVHVTGGTELTLTRVNEILSVVGERFGGKRRTTVGAVIDENFNGRVEICVLGTSDLSSRRPIRGARMPAAHGGGLPADAAPAPVTPGGAEPVPVKVPLPKAKAKQKPVALQEEFLFGDDDVHQRGYFDKTDRNLFDGEDLDVPTYLRRGIRIKLDV